DAPESAYYKDAVNWAAAKGITSGISGTEFGPEVLCTRGQMMTFLWTLAGRSFVNYAMQYKDADADAYYAEAVRWAVSEGITSGKNAAEFAPGDYCTRAQAVTFLWLMAGKPEADYYAQFADVKDGSYYAKAVSWAASAGITSGVGSNNFGPERNCTRAQMVSFLYSYSKLQAD
ncbi:MAG: S-layer homology domain-containing protein, partial [Clostridia bacterium]|nr:S-layer homology domain-containing protein [Clostridia bacterium]